MMEADNEAHIEALDKECFDLQRRTLELIERIGWGEGGKYTFKDGVTWSRFDPEGREQ
jgi:hypothetical protein